MWLKKINNLQLKNKSRNRRTIGYMFLSEIKSKLLPSVYAKSKVRLMEKQN